jgi:excinuclease UvrABC ATPase subunit
MDGESRKRLEPLQGRLCIDIVNARKSLTHCLEKMERHITPINGLEREDLGQAYEAALTIQLVGQQLRETLEEAEKQYESLRYPAGKCDTCRGRGCVNTRCTSCQGTGANPVPCSACAGIIGHKPDCPNKDGD